MYVPPPSITSGPPPMDNNKEEGEKPTSPPGGNDKLYSPERLAYLQRVTAGPLNPNTVYQAPPRTTLSDTFGDGPEIGRDLVNLFGSQDLIAQRIAALLPRQKPGGAVSAEPVAAPAKQSASLFSKAVGALKKLAPSTTGAAAATPSIPTIIHNSLTTPLNSIQPQDGELELRLLIVWYGGPTENLPANLQPIRKELEAHVSMAAEMARQMNSTMPSGSPCSTVCSASIRKSVALAATACRPSATASSMLPARRCPVRQTIRRSKTKCAESSRPN